MIKEGQHVCECGNKIFAVVGEATTQKLLFNDELCVMCVRCQTLYNAKTGEKVD